MDRDKETIELELLILRCQRGERDAFQALAQHWSVRLFAYARRLVEQEQDAWDVVQQTWIRVLPGIRTLREPQRFPAWVYRVARNTALNHRRAKRQHDMPPLDAAPEPADEEKPMLEDAEAVHVAIGELSLAHQEVLTLFFLQDLTIEEIAEVLGLPPGTVKSRIHYAKRMLRAVCCKDGE